MPGQLHLFFQIRLVKLLLIEEVTDHREFIPAVNWKKPQLPQKIHRTVLHAVKQVCQIGIEIVVDLHASGIRRLSKQHPATAAKHLNVTVKFYREHGIDKLSEGLLSTHPADKAIDATSPPCLGNGLFTS